MRYFAILKKEDREHRIHTRKLESLQHILKENLDAGWSIVDVFKSEKLSPKDFKGE